MSKFEIDNFIGGIFRRNHASHPTEPLNWPEGLPLHMPMQSSPVDSLPGVVPVHSERPAITPETKEKPYDFFVVIADDDGIAQQRMNESFQKLYPTDSDQRNAFTNVSSVQELLEQAFTGNHGMQANVVTLDDRYEYNRDKWDITPDVVLRMVRKLRIPNLDLSPRTESSQFHTWPNVLYESRTSSITLAMLLRRLGYEGKIFVCSNDAPDVDEIRRKFSLSTNMTNWPTERQFIDGFADKKAFKGRYACANKIVFEDFQWQWNVSQIEADDFSEVLKHMLS